MKKSITLLSVGFLSLVALTGCVKNKKSDSSSSTTSENSAEDTEVTSSIEDITTGGKVTKEEYLQAFENFKKETNYTLESNMVIESRDDVDDPAEKIARIQSTKRDGLKLETSDDIEFDEIFDEKYFEYFYESQELTTDEEKLAAYNFKVATIKDAGLNITEKRENYIKICVQGENSTDFAEYIEDNDEFVIEYEYESPREAFYKTLTFKEDCYVIDDQAAYAFFDILANENIYDSLAYDEENEKYLVEDIEQFIIDEMDDESIEEIEDVESLEISVSFDNKKLVGAKFIADYGDGSYMSQIFTIKDRGTSAVTLPTNIISCDHIERSFLDSDYNSEYHYQYCRHCSSVLSYEKHNLICDGKMCSACDYDNYCKNKYYLDLGDEHMSSHFAYWADERNGEADDYSFYDLDCEWNEEQQTYIYHADCEEDCGLVVIRKDYEEQKVEGYPCASIGETEWTFIDSKNDNQVLKTIITKDFNSYHDFDYSYEYGDETDPCKVITTKTCPDCGLTYSKTEYDHDITTHYSADGCTLITTEECGCGYQNTYSVVSHKDLVIDSKVENSRNQYNCHCEECGEEFVKFYDKFEYYDQAFHEVRSRDMYDNMIGWVLLEHVYDENGVCIYCDYDKTEDEYTVEKIYSYYEGADYMYLIYYPNGDLYEFDYPEYMFDITSSEDGTSIEGRSTLSDYRFTIDGYNSSEEVYRIYKGEQLIKEITKSN